MKVLVDMNLSPRWVPFLRGEGHDAQHWSALGAPDAPDAELMAWAEAHGFVVFTNDLDFSAILASTGRTAPSVIQLRAQDLLPDAMGAVVVQVLRQVEAELRAGALVSVDVERARIRLLPLRP